jgi:heme oxygenase
MSESAPLKAQMPPGAAAPGILAHLRMVTRGAHASIESVPSLRRLLSPDLTATDYVATLRHMRAFQGSLEPLLALRLNGASGADRLLDGNQLAALDADLAWFHAAPLQPPRLPAPSSAAAALGALYVLEGSNLGGRIIGKHVARTLGVRPGSGGSFHCGLGAEDARGRWQILTEVMRIEVDQAGIAFEPVTAAALGTFGALEAWMRETGSPNASGLL